MSLFELIILLAQFYTYEELTFKLKSLKKYK